MNGHGYIYNQNLHLVVDHMTDLWQETVIPLSDTISHGPINFDSAIIKNFYNFVISAHFWKDSGSVNDAESVSFFGSP